MEDSRNKIEAWARGIAKGDERAFREFYDEYFAKIYRFLLSIVRDEDDAEDVTSVAFTYVWNSRGKLKKPEQLVSWLYQVAKHRGFDLLRKRAGYREEPLEYLADVVADDSPDLEERVDRYYDQKLISELLEVLSPEERSVIHLRFGEGLNSQEIALRISSTSVAVRVRLHRALKKLHDLSGVTKPSHKPGILNTDEEFGNEEVKEVYD